MELINKIGRVLLMGCLFISFTAVSPCDSDSFLEDCAPALGEFTYIKTLKVDVDGDPSKIKSKYILSKGNKYRFVSCDQDDEKNKMKVKLFDRNQKVIMSNYLSSNRKYYPTFEYTCTATGVYYIEASFKPGKTGCGAVMLGFTL